MTPADAATAAHGPLSALTAAGKKRWWNTYRKAKATNLAELLARMSSCAACVRGACGPGVSESSFPSPNRVPVHNHDREVNVMSTSTIFEFHAVKGGAGCTTVTVGAAFAHADATGRPVHVVSADRDALTVIGAPQCEGATVGLVTVHPVDPGHVPVAASELADEGPVFVDAGTAGPLGGYYAGREVVTVLVVRNCYLHLRRAAGVSYLRPDRAVLVREAGRALGVRDVSNVIGVQPVVVDVSEGVARAIDAGLFGLRRPREFDRALAQVTPAPAVA